MSAIGVVILNWNELEHTTSCLASLLAALPRPARVVVVDNASIDGSADALERWIAERGVDQIALVRSAVNRGFAGGVNFGLAALDRHAGLTHYLLLNNDATVERSFFGELQRALERAPDAAIVGPTIYWGSGRDRVWYAGGTLPRVRLVARHHRTVPANDAPVPTEFVTGCAFLISRGARERLGPLPESYFIYFEDAEYCRRARDASLQVLHAPGAVIHHAVEGTMGRGGRRGAAYYQFTRSQALYLRRNLTGLVKWSAFAYFVITRPVRAAMEAIRGRSAVASALVRGMLQGLLAPPGELGKQASITGETA